METEKSSQFKAPSRKWDMLARRKEELLNELYSHPDYEDGMRQAEQQTIID